MSCMKFCKMAAMKNIQKNKHSEGSKVEIDKETDEAEESVIQGECDGRKKKK